MTNSIKFAAAHALTRQTIRRGDCYRTTFGAALRLLSAAAKGDIDASDALWQLGTAASRTARKAIAAAERTIEVGYHTAETVERAINDATETTAVVVAIAAATVAIAATVAESMPRGKGRAEAVKEARDTADAISPLAADAQASAAELAA